MICCPRCDDEVDPREPGVVHALRMLPEPGDDGDALPAWFHPWCWQHVEQSDLYRQLGTV